MSDYDSTPSFYNTDDTFEKYLGQTSYYLGLQNSVKKLVGEVDPDGVVEMGSGTGETAFELSDTFSEINITGIDNREKVIQLSRERLDEIDAANLSFEVDDMRDYVTDADLPEMLIFLYSFHHIPDPLERKVTFLEDCFANLDAGAYICIAETFLTIEGRSERADREVRTTWANRGLEGYASTFWSALDGIDEESIQRAREIGEFSRDHELEAGENVLHRDDEYLVTLDWLTETASDTGFDVVLAEPTNAFGEAVVLLRKPA
jgi:hypothetical protein